MKQQENKAKSSKVDEKQKSKLEAVMNTAEEKLDKATTDAGEVIIKYFLWCKITKYLIINTLEAYVTAGNRPLRRSA